MLGTRPIPSLANNSLSNYYFFHFLSSFLVLQMINTKASFLNELQKKALNKNKQYFRYFSLSYFSISDLSSQIKINRTIQVHYAR